MANSAIATVVAITGVAYARNADGEQRVLKPGDVLLEGETVVTPDGGRVELSLMDGAPLVVDDLPEMKLTADLIAERASSREESAVEDETVDEILAALEEGGDLNELLEATAAGGASGGAGGEGHSFIRLGRIVEGTSEFSGIAGSGDRAADEVIEQDLELPTVDAIDDSTRTDQGEPVTISVEDNDLFEDGYTIIDFTDPGNGSAVLNPNGTITYTPNEGFSGTDTFTYTAASNAGDEDTAVVTIVVDPPIVIPPVEIFISIDDVVVTEGETATLTISLSEASETAVSVRYASLDDTATVEGGDYDPDTQTITFAPGTTEIKVSYQTNVDNIQEGAEDFLVNLSDASGATIADPQGVVTIVDDYVLPEISIDDVTVLEGAQAMLTVSLSRAVEVPVSVTFETEDDTAVAAVVGGDYDAATGILTIDANTTEVEVTFQTKVDDLQEGTERFLVNLTNPENATIADDQGVVTIIDNFTNPSIASVSVNDVTVNEDAGTLTFTITKTGATTLAGSVSYTISPDSATTPADYTANDAFVGSVNFAANETSKTVTVNITDDNIDELTETFNINLSAAANLNIADGAGVGTILDNDAVPVLSVNDMTVNEEDGTLTFTVTKTGSTTQAVTVDYDITPDSATTPADYSADDALSGSLNFAANETSQTVTVAITDDLIDELDETFDITLSNVSATATIGDGEGVGTILDNDPAPTVSVDDVTVNEEDGTLTFTITKTGLTSQPGSVSYAITPDSATTPADYTPNDAFVGTVNFAANEVSKQVTVNIIDDEIDELTETFDINLSAPVNLTIADGAGVGTILDNDRAPVLSVNDMTVNEDAGTLTFTVTKTGLTSQAVTVDYDITPDSATTPADYSADDALTGSLSFAANETSQTVTVAITDDLIDELDETFDITLSNPGNATIGDGAGVGTILDNDPAPTVSVNDMTVNEDAGTLTFTITKTGLTSQAGSVNYAITPDSATTPADYTPNDGFVGTVNFAANEVSKQVTVNIIDDEIDELTETFDITLSTPVNLTIDDGAGVGTILDNDPAPVLSVNDMTVNEDAGTLTFTVTKTGLTSQAVTVDYDITPDSATTPADYSASDALSGSLNFAANETSQTVTVAITDDLIDELDETFDITLSNPGNATIGDGAGVGTILDNDPAPTVSVNDMTVNEDAGTLTFTITKTGLTSQAGSVNYAITPDSATTPADYTANDAFAGTVNFAANETSKTVTVNIIDDNIDELTETFDITLSTPVNLTIDDGAGVGTILDNDSGPVLSVNDMTVNEDAGTLTFTVTKAGLTTQAVTVDYDITPDSATTPADYSASDALSGSLNFAANESSKTVTVAITDDLIDELTETFDITLSNVSANATIGDGEGVGTILDNDPAPTVSVNDMTVNEDAGTLTFTITKTGLTSQAGSVNYAITPDSATTPADYTANDAFAGTVNFAANETSKTVTVNIIDDNIDELTETFDITLSTPVNLTIADGAGVGTILDNDDGPVLSVNDMTVNEDAGTLTFTVTKTGLTSQAVTVDYDITPDSATTPADYSADDALSGSLNFAANETSKTVTVAITDDLIDELDETFDITLSNPGNATIGDGAGVGTILDNDPAPTVSVNDMTVNEDAGTLTFTITKTGLTSLAGSVSYAITPDSATTPADYTANDAFVGTVNFAANEVSKQVTVNIIDDNIDELTETFDITLSAPVNLTIADGAGVGTILDNDDGPVLSVNDMTVNEEDGTLTFTVSKAGLTTQAVTVDYDITPDSATTPADYSADDALSGSLNFAANETSKTVTVAITDDLIDELDETFDITLSNVSANATIGDGEGVGTILDNDPAPSVSVDDVTVSEEDGTLTFTITKTGLTSLAGSVSYAITPDSATTPADYTANDAFVGTVNFAANEVSKQVTVNIIDDNIDELTETFDITLSAPVNLTIADGAGVGTILDNDDPMLDTGDGVEVDEANLVEGTDPDAPSLTKSGEFTYAAVSPVTLMIGGANQALAAVAQGETVAGEHGTLTLGASSAPDVDGVVTVSYTYTLTSNEDHDGEDGKDIFQVTFVDGGGVQLAPPQDMEVSIIDDVPDDFTPDTAIVSKASATLTDIDLNFLDGAGVDGDRGVGADGAGTVLAPTSLNATQVTAAGGQTLKYNGETLTWEISAGGTVIKAISDVSNIEAIVITLDGSGDHYDLSIDDDFNFSIGNDIDTFTAENPVNGGNADNFYIINVGGEDIDVRVTTNNGGTVNTDSSDFGANSQWLNDTESLTFDFFTNIDPNLNGSTNTDIVGLPDGEVNSFQFRIDQGNPDAYDKVTATAFLDGGPVVVGINVVSGPDGTPGDGTVFEVTGVSNFDSLTLLASGDANGKNLSITPLGFTEFSPSDIVMKVDLEGFDSDDTNDESAGSIIFGIDQDDVVGVDLDYVEAAPAAAFQAFSQPVVAEASSEPELNLIDASSEPLIGTIADDVFVWDLADAGAAGTPDNDVVSDFGNSGTDALDLSDLLVDAGSDLTSYLSVTEESGSTVIKVSTGGDVGDATQVDQVITLDGVGFADLGLDINDGMSTIIQDMVSAGKLITD